MSWHLPLRCILLLLLALAVSSASAVVPATWKPRPGEYVWQPAIAPAGPLLIVVSLPLQQLHVYRNGVRIGASSISSGKPGHETPVGLFTILQKEVEHYSNLYDSAPMPFMQRLTWDGVALHAGVVPGRPASHGCIRLPEAFAKALFNATRTGDTVIVTDRQAQPGIAAAGEVLRGLPSSDAPAASGDFWTPELSPGGPVSVVLSLSDARLVVTRNGVRIGQAALRVEPGLVLGTHAYVLLDGAAEGVNPVLPDRPARRWMSIDLTPGTQDEGQVKQAIATGRIGVPAEIARRVEDLLQPGATVVITDQPLGDRAQFQRIDVEAGGR
ncbi:L,D-transpeptidase [Cognatilysobacter segetis]|uniref:L,D-transpeptidase n=1 Tax=Cognatilysobacter segetis TaxID=2492394 RepID=UPI00138FE3E4|nr:L,D-transpeptidase [Lysobacter segetis]